MKKVLIYILTTVLIMGLCTGCSTERKEEQLKLREQGITYLENGQYEGALTIFANALDLSLGEIGEVELDICYYKAEALHQLGKLEEAIDTYSAIIEYNNSPKAYFLRGNLYYSMDKEAEALKDYESATKYEKKDYALYIGIYESLMSHEKTEEAMTYLNKSLEIKGTSAQDKMNKGWIKFLLGNKAEAVSLLEEAIAEKEPMAHYYLAEIYIASGEADAAQEALNAYISSGVGDSYKLYSLAEEQLARGYLDLAIICLEAALTEKVPNQQIIMKTLVMAYEKSGNFVAARATLESYIELYPDDEEALREYTFLETR